MRLYTGLIASVCQQSKHDVVCTNTRYEVISDLNNNHYGTAIWRACHALNVYTHSKYSRGSAAQVRKAIHYRTTSCHNFLW